MVIGVKHLCIKLPLFVIISLLPQWPGTDIYYTSLAKKPKRFVIRSLQ